MPKVSIIVPNFNHAKYLRQRLDSIFLQTYQDFEVILLDDCSYDNSIEILTEYAANEKVSHFIINKKNSGNTFIQWEEGIKLAKGDYIWIAESDDWCEPILLETLINSFNKHPNLVLSYVQSYFIVNDNEIKIISKQNYLENIMNGNTFIKNYLLHYNEIWNASMVVFKKSAFLNMKIDFKSFTYCGDWIIWAGIAKHGDVFISGKILNYFRKHDCNVSTKAHAIGLNIVEELKVLFSFLDNNFITEDDFLNALKKKHINYKFSKVKYSSIIETNIENHFYLDEHTVKYKRILKKDYTRAYIMQINVLSILKKIIKNCLIKIGLWEKVSLCIIILNLLKILL